MSSHKTSVNLIFPHQLFEKSPLLENGNHCYLIEEFLFFQQYQFHKKKLLQHVLSMRTYAQHIQKNHKCELTYIETHDPRNDIRNLIDSLAEEGVDELCYVDPCDNWLQKHMSQAAEKNHMQVQRFSNPSFLNKKSELAHFFKPSKKNFLQSIFYKQQRIKRQILVDKEKQPKGGKWSFDAENRKKYPAKKQPPEIKFPQSNSLHTDAIEYVNKHFPQNPGSVEGIIYPYSFSTAQQWLENFLIERFEEFGPYEDAIVSDQVYLNHSLLTPMLNTGLLTPQHIIDKIIEFAENKETRLNSVEGLIRQIIGWREFIRGMYMLKGTQQRTTNYWGFKRKIPKSFYTGDTGIDPVDDSIKKVLETGYCHHIERLMILGNFMLLCEFDPDEVYRWFMELFIDAYDWVMVPNVYGMSQFSDGGLMATKPYISGSNYIIKMSDYKKDNWSDTWDALFWRFMHTHREFFLSNPRLGMLVGNFDKMSKQKRNELLETAEDYLQSL